MGEAPQVIQLNIIGDEQEKQESNEPNLSNEHPTTTKTKKVSRWIRITAYTISLVVGQSGAILLGRVYFTKGGNSQWLGTVVQLVGFPVLIPFYYILPRTHPLEHPDHQKPPSRKLLGSIYTVLGLLMGGSTLLYTVGLQYLPVTTYTLLQASQLAFNALFSFFLNGQKFTPYIVNSLVLLTISSALLVFQPDDDVSTTTTPVSKGKYALGFICTTLASAGCALLLSLGQVVFTKVLKGKDDFKYILDMVVYESLVASVAAIIGLFASGEWRTLPKEMEMYQLGKVSYIMILVWTALLWEVFSVGIVGLIFEVSSLFSNVISTFGLPVTPVLAVIFLHDKINGITAIAMALAIWGFVSYAYQQYLDEYKNGTNKKDDGGENDDCEAPRNECP